MESTTSLISGTSSAKSGGSNTPMFMDSNKGNIKEQYHFKEKLANGGFGVVYLAEHRSSKDLFAVKAIQKKKVKDYATFVNEINILKVLVSWAPLIIYFFIGPPSHHKAARDLGVEWCLFLGAWVSKIREIINWLIYRYCKGGELFHFILDRKHLTEKEAAMIMKQLLSALMYLHQNNISHR